MPYKIVQTIERGKTFLSCVPSAWEDENMLMWPKKGSKKLQKNEESQPGEDWISTPCTVKRSNLTYDDAQLELFRMQRESDTEEEPFSKKRQQRPIEDMNEWAMQCITNKENVPPMAEAPEQEPAQIEFTPNPSTAENAQFVTSESPFIVQQDNESNTLYYISSQPKSNFEETILKRLDKIENQGENIMRQLSRLDKIENQGENIMRQLSHVSTQIDAFLRQIQQQKLNSEIGFKKIENINELENFNDDLKNKETFALFKEKLLAVCGSEKGSGINNCYSLIEVMFSRRFLTECSWAGGSKDTEIRKNCFKAYTRVINLFFEVIHQSDKTFTLLECEMFFKNVLRNSRRRYAAKMLRSSTTKKRTKGKGTGKQSKTVIPERTTDGPTQPGSSTSM